MKYIVFQCTSPNKPTLHLGVTFPDVMVHADVAEMMEHVKVQPDGPGSSWWMRPKAVSAGFITDGHCHGESESLELHSHIEDAAIIKTGRGVGYQERPVNG